MNFIDLLQMFCATVTVLAIVRVLIDALREENAE